MKVAANYSNKIFISLNQHKTGLEMQREQPLLWCLSLRFLSLTIGRKDRIKRTPTRTQGRPCRGPEEQLTFLFSSLRKGRNNIAPSQKLHQLCWTFPNLFPSFLGVFSPKSERCQVRHRGTGVTCAASHSPERMRAEFPQCSWMSSHKKKIN